MCDVAWQVSHVHQHCDGCRRCRAVASPVRKARHVTADHSDHPQTRPPGSLRQSFYGRSARSQLLQWPGTSPRGGHAQWSNCKIRARGTLSPPFPFPLPLSFPLTLLSPPSPLPSPALPPLRSRPLRSS